MAEQPEIEVLKDFRPEENELGMLYPVICLKCGSEADVWVSRVKERPENGAVATCPVCQGKMSFNPSGTNILGNCRGKGVSSTKYGDKRRRELIARNNRLSKTQWDQVEPQKLSEGMKARNPTPDGPYDPNGRMGKKKREKTLFLPGSST